VAVKLDKVILCPFMVRIQVILCAKNGQIIERKVVKETYFKPKKTFRAAEMTYTIYGLRYQRNKSRPEKRRETHHEIYTLYYYLYTYKYDLQNTFI
jgi:hypothetical protein